MYSGTRAHKHARTRARAHTHFAQTHTYTRNDASKHAGIKISVQKYRISMHAGIEMHLIYMHIKRYEHKDTCVYRSTYACTNLRPHFSAHFSAHYSAATSRYPSAATLCLRSRIAATLSGPCPHATFLLPVALTRQLPRDPPGRPTLECARRH